MKKLAIITSHPIQYYAPWFRYLAQQPDLSVRVFYLWDFGITQRTDHGFQQSIQWDIPLLSGYDFEFVPNTSKKPGTSHFWGLQNPTLLAQVEAYQPDAVLLMNYNYASLYHFLLHWDRRKAPLLFRGDTHHLNPGKGIKETLRRAWLKIIYQRFSACLYVGQANYGYFQDHGVPADRLFFAPHAIENDRFFAESAQAHLAAQQWKQELGIPDSHQVILFAGKFTETKRPLDLLEAFLQAGLPNVSLLYVGTGPLEAALRNRAADHPHVYFAPFQNQTLMPRTYAISDLVVLPSYGETWGLAINEAMCLGKPVIVSHHVGCSLDLVRSGWNGLVFPAGDVPFLALSLQAAFRSPAQLKIWGEQSRQMILHYSYEQTTAGLKAALSSLGVLQIAAAKVIQISDVPSDIILDNQFSY